MAHHQGPPAAVGAGTTRLGQRPRRHTVDRHLGHVNLLRHPRRGPEVAVYHDKPAQGAEQHAPVGQAQSTVFAEEVELGVVVEVQVFHLAGRWRIVDGAVLGGYAYPSVAVFAHRLHHVDGQTVFSSKPDVSAAGIGREHAMAVGAYPQPALAVGEKAVYGVRQQPLVGRGVGQQAVGHKAVEAGLGAYKHAPVLSEEHGVWGEPSVSQHERALRVLAAGRQRRHGHSPVYAALLYSAAAVGRQAVDAPRAVAHAIDIHPVEARAEPQTALPVGARREHPAQGRAALAQ